MARAMLWFALAVVGVGLVASGWLIILSLRPEPGSNMVLMVLPYIVGPVAIIAGPAAGIALMNNERLKSWEQWSAVVAGGLALFVFGALAVMG